MQITETKEMATRDGIRRFSLMELLVVISVIAILVALLLPSLVRAKASAQQVACYNNFRQIGFSFKLYADDYDDVTPESYLGHKWCYTLVNHSLNDPRVLLCPADPSASNCSEGYQHNVQPNNSRWVMTFRGHQTRLRDCPWPEGTVNFCDAKPRDHILDHDADPPGSEVQWNDITPTTDDLRLRHLNKMNILFLDGHVQFSRTIEETRGTWYYYEQPGGTAPWSWWGPKRW
ncbi:MAG: hypothetical protein D6820_15205 [Lentisphaerae bacterium]|nr:MAG: hypothetical protein D6820_15205 [Lentisphaerota bacterium]